MTRVLTAVRRLAQVEQHRPRREDDGIGHRNDELPSRQPAQERQLKAIPDEADEQRVDLLQVFSQPNLRWSDACLNFHHFDAQSWPP